MAAPMPRDAGRFWFRLVATMGLFAIPLSWGLVVEGMSPLVIASASVVTSFCLLAIWDGTRWLPKGLVWWARPEPLADEATGVFNPAGWHRLLEAEDDRCRRHDLDASVIVVHVEPPAGAGDSADRQAGSAIASVVRTHDVVGHLDTATFGVLAVAAGADDCAAVLGRVGSALRADGFGVSFGVADRRAGADLFDACERARAAAARIVAA